MKKSILEMRTLRKYKEYLYEEERSQATITKYMRDVMQFYHYLPEGYKVITKEVLVTYKNSLSDKYKISSINSMLAALNGLLDFMKLSYLKLKLHKIQRSVFYEEEQELTKNEYKRLLDCALRKGNKRLYMLMQTICGTGIRGAVFITKSGKPMDRSNIWNAMKKLCREAKVSDKKVFPHNLRHLFALTYYRMQKDVVRLADILGHASIETTRTYTMTTGNECQKSLSKMNLVVPIYT